MTLTRLFLCILTESQAILMPSTYRRTTSYIIYTQKSSGFLAHTKESAAAIQKRQIIHVGGCPAHTLKNESYETVAIVTHKHLLNKQWRTNSCHGCKGEQATQVTFFLCSSIKCFVGLCKPKMIFLSRSTTIYYKKRCVKYYYSANRIILLYNDAI